MAKDDQRDPPVDDDDLPIPDAGHEDDHDDDDDDMTFVDAPRRILAPSERSGDDGATRPRADDTVPSADDLTGDAPAGESDKDSDVEHDDHDDLDEPDDDVTFVDVPKDSSHKIRLSQEVPASSLSDPAFHDTVEDQDGLAKVADATAAAAALAELDAAPPADGIEAADLSDTLAPLSLPDPEPGDSVRGMRKVTDAGARVPWWSWRGWRRRTKVLSVIGATLLVTLVVTWFMLPTIIAYFIRKELPKIEEKLGRKVDFEGVELHGLSGMSMTGVVVFDAESDNRFIEVERVTVELTKTPIFYRDFKVDRIGVERPEIHLKRGADGSTNYDDFVEKLEKLFKPKKKKKKKKEPSEFAKYIKPLPKIEITNGAITMDDESEPDIAFLGFDNVSVTVTQSDHYEPFDIEVETDVDLRIGERELSETIRVAGYYKNKTHGRFTVSVKGGLEVPLIDEIAGINARVGDLTLDLPATFTAKDLVVLRPEGTTPMVSADTIKVELTQLPPKKIAGVYITETEIDGLFAEIHIDEDGTTDAHRIARKVSPPPSRAQVDAKKLYRWIEKGARAANGIKQYKPKGFNIADYFYSQRVFINDAEIRIHDQTAGGAGDVALETFSLELGYRPLQRRVELAIDTKINAKGTASDDALDGGRVWLGGGFALKQQTLHARLDLDKLSLTPLAGHLQPLLDGLVAESEDGANDPGYIEAAVATLASSIRLHDASLTTDALIVEADIKKRRYDVTGKLEVDDLRIESPALSKFPIDDLDLGADLVLAIDGEADTFSLSKADLDLRGAKAQTTFAMRPATVEDVVDPELKGKRRDKAIAAAAERAAEEPLGTTFEWALLIPEQPAQDVISSVPHGLAWALDGMQVEGTLGYRFNAAGLTHDVTRLQVDTEILGEGFRVVQWSEHGNIANLNHGMRMAVLDPRATVEHTIEIPPSTHAPSRNSELPPAHDGIGFDGRYPHWVRYGDLSPWLVQLITTTEDGGFFSHAGFSKNQFLSAFQDNIDEGGFVRGASTISMQLIKNVYLGRRKTVARKVQEVFLTWLMESVMRVPKQRILEVYFNVIEFGPEVYGIADASRYYFGKRASDLTLREAAFLVSIIPRPRSAEMHRARGEVTEKKSKRMNWYIEKMHQRKCDPEKLARIRAKYEANGRAMPFDYCCPSLSGVQAMMQQRVQFYTPMPDEAEFRPDLYHFDGSPIAGQVSTGCNVGDAGLRPDTEGVWDAIDGGETDPEGGAIAVPPVDEIDEDVGDEDPPALLPPTP